ncbi:MAG: acyl-CoA thioesterase [Kiritimatiellia bacterium]|jgi:1,4-dihydroxy-2-naphthoyl-CoA hydrolase
MKPFAYRIKLGDTDAAGRLYFVAAFRIAHDAFEEAMATIGLPVHEIVQRGNFAFPVVHADATYSAPVLLGDMVYVNTLVKRVGNSSVNFQYEIKNAAGEIAIKVEIIHVSISAETGETIPLPDPLRTLLSR